MYIGDTEVEMDVLACTVYVNQKFLISGLWGTINRFQVKILHLKKRFIYLFVERERESMRD